MRRCSFAITPMGRDVLCSLTNVQLTAQVLELLTPPMTTQHFSSFAMDRNEFVYVRDDIHFAVESIKHNSRLRSFHWTNNPIRHIHDGNILLEAMYDHPTVDHIQIENSRREPGIGYYILSSILVNNI